MARAAISSHSIRRAWACSAWIIAAGLVAPAAQAQAIDPAKSVVVATFKQMGVPVTGTFDSVTGRVVYDPANLAASTARIELAIASVDLGDAQYNREILKAEWFDAAHFPTATFAMRAIHAGTPERFEATGKLTIKGHSVDVIVPVSVKHDRGTTIFEGTLPIHRIAFDIGAGEWKDTGLVADEVVIQFRLAVRTTN